MPRASVVLDERLHLKPKKPRLGWVDASDDPEPLRARKWRLVRADTALDPG